MQARVCIEFDTDVLDGEDVVAAKKRIVKFVADLYEHEDKKKQEAYGMTVKDETLYPTSTLKGRK